MNIGPDLLCLYAQSVSMKQRSQLTSSFAAVSARAHRIRVLKNEVRCGDFVVRPEVIASGLMRDWKVF